MEIPGLGLVTKVDRFDWYRSQPIQVPVLGGQICQIVVASYDDDLHREEYHTAISNFLLISPSVLTEVEPHLFRYYECCIDSDNQQLNIESPAHVWHHIRFGREPIVMRRAYGDKGIYISLECSCDWESEHGLQIVFKNGLRVNKIGPCDGHLTNSDSYANDDFEDVVYAEW